MFAHGGSAVPLGVYLLRWCGEKENSLAVLYVIFAVGNFLIRGLTRRLRRGVQVQSRGVVNSLWQTNRGGCRGRAESPCKRHYKATLPKAVPAGGLTRRLRRGWWDCRTEGGKYFLSKRKKVPKKARGTATTGKRLLLPILTAGLAMSRAMELDSYHLRLERARARLFPPSKWAGLFPSAAYRRSACPQLALGRLNQCELGCCIAAWMASQHRKQY